MDSEEEKAKKFLTKPRKIIHHKCTSDLKGMTVKIENGSIYKLLQNDKLILLSTAENERGF